MTGINRKIEPTDVMTSLAALSVSLEEIEARGYAYPPEIYDMIAVASGLLEIRRMVNVQKSKHNDSLSRINDELFSVATEFINHARSVLVMEAITGVTIDDLLGQYRKSISLARRMIRGVDRSWEQRFKVTLEWKS